MKKSINGKLTELDGELFYKIENFDLMEDFFMTITSSSDVWNFCWSKGGITAGRKNSDNSIFPYYTCDKIQDLKNTTGAFTLVSVKRSEGRQGILWQPFANLNSRGLDKKESLHLTRNIYKSTNGSKIWFEEVNAELGLSFRYGWTSSKKFGLVKMSRIQNLTERKMSVQILDGVRNVMPPQITSDLQNIKSVLIDAYKTTQIDEESEVALFSLSSLITDKAEPAECLSTNVSWFSVDEPVLISSDAVRLYLQDSLTVKVQARDILNGKRPECFIVRNIELEGEKSDFWEQVLDVNYDAVKLCSLKNQLKDRMHIRRELYEDIEETSALLDKYIAESDGLQISGDKIQDLHHKTNVMFNIMRGGIFQTEEGISVSDLLSFIKVRNVELASVCEGLFKKNKIDCQKNITKEALMELAGNNLQLKRIFLEYLPMTFSRRHGDPSRPWNRFNIDLTDSEGNAKLNYEGNWRDIFQNWEALLWSYPEYASNFVIKFLNAMTVEGFNPYRITREGIDWEVPEEGNPWAQFGYWTDHQVIYLQKLLEFFYDSDNTNFTKLLGEKIFTSANVPYRIKSYRDVLADPRSSIKFDYDVEKSVKEKEKTYGTDARLVLDPHGNVQQTTMATKLIQLILAKVFNFIPGAGLWMNTQRPEWNDANNALAGFGASIVTAAQLYRMMSFLSKLLEEDNISFEVNTAVLECLKSAAVLYEMSGLKAVTDSKERKEFTDKAGKLFESELKILYSKGFDEVNSKVKGREIAELLKRIEPVIKETILVNKRKDGLFESYNTIKINVETIEVENLKLMLEGQVAVLSANLLTASQTVELTKAMKKSALFEENQHSYLLYPKTELPVFAAKNYINAEEVTGLENFIKKTDSKILERDEEGIYHFVSKISNADILKLYISLLNENEKPNAAESERLFALYEKTFNHQKFTGRSGAFYGYEGLGCIYWHMVSKLLLAVQENLLGNLEFTAQEKKELTDFYEDVKAGLGYKKSPQKYGAFPFDPYSHTPYLGGAKQPGMTGQVKEEVIVRFKELGLSIEKGCAAFRPELISKKDFDDDSKITFTWCGTKVVYEQTRKTTVKITVKLADKTTVKFNDYCLDEETTKMLFTRSNKIKEICVNC